MRGFSLASRFLVTLVLTAVLPLLLYGWFSLRGMRDQIDEHVVRVFLPQLAADHAQKIEAHLERTHQACAIVREIARTALDSPDAMSAFEEQVELVPDLLDNYVDLLLLAEPSGRVVYWQDGQRLDPSAHGRRAALIPESVADTDWFQAVHRERGVRFLPWGRSKYLHRGDDFRSLDPASHHLGVALDVPCSAGTAVLFALVRWSEVQAVIDQAREVLVERASLRHAKVMLVGREGVVQAHTDRVHYGARLHGELAAQIGPAKEPGRGAFVGDDGRAWRIGYAPCAGQAAGPLMVGVMVPEAELFAASEAFERVLVAAIVVTILVLVLWSLVASRAIVAPVQTLVAATQAVAHGDLGIAVHPRGGPELGTLARAFNRMAADLASGRAKLAAAERDQAWAEMARQVAHEVKNPLQPMRMAAQLLQRARAEQDPRADQIADRLARTVLEQTDALDRIASDFRAFAGIAPEQRVVVPIDDWLAELCRRHGDLFAGKAVTLRYQPGAGEAKVAIEAKAIGRVFLNLIQNAHEAAPAGVSIDLAAVVANGQVTVTVADDGPGVPDAVRARLFEPYFTTKTSGTGLGLAICRRLVEAHGGTIRLTTTGPSGTVFTIQLPVAPAGA